MPGRLSLGCVGRKGVKSLSLLCQNKEVLTLGTHSHSPFPRPPQALFSLESNHLIFIRDESPPHICWGGGVEMEEEGCICANVPEPFLPQTTCVTIHFSLTPVVSPELGTSFWLSHQECLACPVLLQERTWLSSSGISLSLTLSVTLVGFLGLTMIKNDAESKTPRHR